jgi:hypothetical protein
MSKSMTVQEIVKLCKELGVDAEALDELVHENKGAEAASINNEGLEAQIEYLGQGNGWSQKLWTELLTPLGKK